MKLKNNTTIPVIIVDLINKMFDKKNGNLTSRSNYRDIVEDISLACKEAVEVFDQQNNKR